MTAEATGAGVVREKSSLGRVMLASAVGHLSSSVFQKQSNRLQQLD